MNYTFSIFLVLLTRYTRPYIGNNEISPKNILGLPSHFHNLQFLTKSWKHFPSTCVNVML